jgi:cytochrome c
MVIPGNAMKAAGALFQSQRKFDGRTLAEASKEDLMRRIVVFTVIAITISAAVAISADTALAQDAQKGQMVFNVCLACHSIGPGAQNKIGPELNGLDGRHSGSAPGFDYSDANKNSGIVWNEATFKKYIQNPQGVIPGTKMIFPGLKNEEQVNDVWAYISQFNADGSKK